MKKSRTRHSAAVISSTSSAVRLMSGTSLASGGSLDLGQTLVGTPITEDITIANSGSADLALSSWVAPSGFTIVTPPDADVAPGASTTVSFDVGPDQLSILDARMQRVVEPGPVVFAAFLVFALSISTALFLVADLSRPFVGLMQLPKQQLEHTLAPLT